jgi:hypothetical protein
MDKACSIRRFAIPASRCIADSDELAHIRHKMIIAGRGGPPRPQHLQVQPARV